MTTTIKHYRNSFLDIENKDLRLLIDPWLNTANEGSWAGSKSGDKLIFKSNSDNISCVRSMYKVQHFFYFLVSSEFFALLCCSDVGLFSGHPKLATCWLMDAWYP